jgi:hypothetical protein
MATNPTTHTQQPIDELASKLKRTELLHGARNSPVVKGVRFA